MKTLIVVASLLFVLSVQAALVEYSYNGQETFTGAGQEHKLTYSGIMIFDTASSNVTFVDWRSDKTYSVSTDTNLNFTTITGPESKTYTTVASSSSGTDTNGIYHLHDYMISGENATLTIATNQTFVFPKIFTGSNNRAIYPDDNGDEWLEIWGETMTFSESLTKADNDDGLSGADVVNAEVAALQRKGYSE